MLTLEKSISDRACKEVANAVATVHDAILIAMDILGMFRGQLFFRLVKTSSGRGPGSVVDDRDRTCFSRDVDETPPCDGIQQNKLKHRNKWD